MVQVVRKILMFKSKLVVTYVLIILGGHTGSVWSALPLLSILLLSILVLTKTMRKTIRHVYQDPLSNASLPRSCIVPYHLAYLDLLASSLLVSRQLY